MYCAQCKARFQNWNSWPLHKKIGAGLGTIAAAGGGMYWLWNPMKKGVYYLYDPVQRLYKKFRLNPFSKTLQPDSE